MEGNLAREVGGVRLYNQMVRLAEQSDRERHKFLVNKLLAKLSDEQLRAAASACVTEPRTLVIECNFADQVWEDPQVKRRVQSLTKQGVLVEKHSCETTLAGQSSTRRQVTLTSYLLRFRQLHAARDRATRQSCEADRCRLAERAFRASLDTRIDQAIRRDLGLIGLRRLARSWRVAAVAWQGKALV